MATAARRTHEPGRSRVWRHSSAVPWEELSLLRTRHPNVLIAGSGDDTEDALGAMVSTFRAPIASWRPGQPLALPAFAGAQTLVLNDVDALPAADQRRLLDWLEHAAGEVQVVATRRRSLIALAESGGFDLHLYYRLNVILIEPSA